MTELIAARLERIDAGEAARALTLIRIENEAFSILGHAARAGTASLPERSLL